MVVRYGVLGCGMMGREHLRNIALIDGAIVAAIGEPDPRMAAQAATLAPGATVVDGLAGLLEVPGLDCLVVATPNYQHVDQLEAIAAKVTLPVLCEKPLYTDPADAARVAALSKSYGAPIWVGMEYRYMPPVAALVERKDAVTGGVTMLSIREHRHPFLKKVGDWNRFNSKSGGTLVEKCCHFFDLMRLIVGTEPVRVMASAGQAVNHRDEVYDGQPSDIWDHAYAIVDFEGGAKAMLELCMFAEASRFQETISAIGPDGRIECAVPGPERLWPKELGPPPLAELSVLPRSRRGVTTEEMAIDAAIAAAGSHYGSTYYEHLRFLQAVQGNGKVEVTLEDGAKAVAMGLAAQESARTGSAVPL